jgi:riboflavin biosynthesis pyrimidine reductase
MRALLPRPEPDADPHAHYASDWIEPGGVRVNFVASVDGAVSVTGLSKGLQTPGDNRVFSALRDLADVVLVGSGTAAAENYRPARFSPARLEIRRSYGLAASLPIAVVSRSLHLDLDRPLYADPGTVVLTCASAGAGAIARVREQCEVLVCGETTIDLDAARDALAARVGARILCEGGPTIFSAVVQAGVATELCLTSSPILVGPGPGRILAGTAFEPVGLTLIGLLEEDDALFHRYRIGAPLGSVAPSA